MFYFIFSLTYLLVIITISGLYKMNHMPIYKCKRKNLEVTKGKEIPGGVGCFLSRFDDVVYQDVKKDLSDLTVASDGLLVVDKIDRKIRTTSFDVEMKESNKEWAAKCDQSYLGSLEEKYRVLIQFNFYGDDLPVDVRTVPGFTLKDTKLEAMDKDGQFKVKFWNNDITTFPADAMVNSSQPNLEFDGLMSGKVAEKAGLKMVKQCEKYIKYRGELRYGEVYSSTAGNLDFHNIIHVASPVWGEHDNEYETNSLLITTTKNILKEANSKKLREIATPAISAGGWGFPIKVSLISIFTGIKQFFDETKHGILKYITLVDINKDATEEVKNSMEKIFGTDHVYTEEKKLKANGKSITCTIIGGTTDKVKKVMEELKIKSDGLFGPVTKYPASWSPMPPEELLRFEKLPKNSVDFMQINNVFTEHIPKAKIKKIERVQCPEKYDGMIAYRKAIVKDLGIWRDEYEMKLWHATSKEAAHKIRSDTFRIPKHESELATDRWHGAGVYFWPTPKVSDTYAKDSDGERHIIRSSVMVGKVKLFEDHKEAKKLANATEPPEGYHSICVNDPEWGIEYVVFRETQACPDYLITYIVED